MARYASFIALLLTLVVGLPMPGSSTAHVCIEPSQAASDIGPTLVSVASTLGVLLDSEPDCGGQPVFHSYAVMCDAPPFIGSVPGAFCGPTISAGGSVRCSWKPVVYGPETLLYAGFDLNQDGHLTIAAGEAVTGPMDPLPAQYVLSNGASGTGRIIAYPTNMDTTEQRGQDESLVGCG